MVKALIVGCGRIAGLLDGHRGAPPASHASAYAATPGLSVAQYVDIFPQKSRALARKYGCPSWGSDLSGALLRHTPDVMSVCTPDNTHFAVAMQALRAAKPPRVIFLEKPACSTPQEFAQLKTLSHSRDVAIVVNHSRRFDGRYQRLRRLIGSGKLGSLVRADAFYYGGWRHNGSHVIDTLRFLFGELKLERIASGAPSRHAGDPTLNAVLRLGRGALAHIHGFDEAHYQLFDFDLKFDRFRLRIENFESRWTLERRVRQGGENVLVPTKYMAGPSRPAPLRRAITAIARYLATDDRSILEPFTLREAENTLRILWEAVKR